MNAAPSSWQLPVFMLAAAMALFLAFHVQRAWQENTALAQGLRALEQPVVESQQVRQRLDRLALATLRLAEGGNENARQLVDKLKQAGVTIVPPKDAKPK